MDPVAVPRHETFSVARLGEFHPDRHDVRESELRRSHGISVEHFGNAPHRKTSEQPDVWLQKNVPRPPGTDGAKSTDDDALPRPPVCDPSFGQSTAHLPLSIR